MFLYMGIMTASTVWSVLATRFVIYATEQPSPQGKISNILDFMSKCSQDKQELNNLQRLSPHEDDNQQQHHSENENSTKNLPTRKIMKWHKIIVCLDKVFFTLFLVIYIVGTLAFLL